MDFVPFVILSLMVTKIIDWLLALIPDDIEAKLLLPVSWAVGVGIALLFSASPELSSAITIWGDNTLSAASIPLVIVYGFAVGTGANMLHDVTDRSGKSGIPFP